MIDIDIYKNVLCHDCNKTFLIPGSTPVSKMFCPICKSTNWENVPHNYQPIKKAKQ